MLIAGRYTLLDRSADEELLPAVRRAGQYVTAGGIFNSGLLVGGSTFDYGLAPPPIADRARELAASCSRHGVPLPAVALQFAFSHPAMSSVLIGARSAEKITQDLRWLNQPVPDELWRDPLFYRPDLMPGPVHGESAV